MEYGSIRNTIVGYFNDLKFVNVGCGAVRKFRLFSFHVNSNLFLLQTLH